MPIAEDTLPEIRELKEHLKISRKEQDDRLKQAVREKTMWSRFAFILLGLLVVAVGGLIHLGRLPKRDVQVLEMTPEGLFALGPVSHSIQLTPERQDQIKQSGMRFFITAWRTVTSDSVMRSKLWDSTFAWVAEGTPAYVYIARWFVEHRPDSRVAAGEIVDVENVRVKSTTAQTMLIEWTERTYKAQDAHEQRWECEVTYRVDGPGISSSAPGNGFDYNGFRIYITHLKDPLTVGPEKSLK